MYGNETQEQNVYLGTPSWRNLDGSCTSLGEKTGEGKIEKENFKEVIPEYRCAHFPSPLLSIDLLY